MREGLNQYAVYRLRRDLRETRPLRNQSFMYLQKHGLKVEAGRYTQAYLSGFDPSQSIYDLRARLEKDLPKSAAGGTLATGDILAVTQNGITNAFYVDPDRLIPVADFFHVPSREDAVTMESRDFQIEGRPGSWTPVDEIWVDGHHFMLMQSLEFGSKAAYAVVDRMGRQVTQDTLQGFTDEVIRQIREHLQRENKVQKEKEAETASATGSTDPDQVRKASLPVASSLTAASLPALTPESGRTDGYENTLTYTENDNNKRTYPRPAQTQKRKRKARRRKKGKRPLKGRESVLKRLRMYQQLLMERHG